MSVAMVRLASGRVQRPMAAEATIVTGEQSVEKGMRTMDLRSGTRTPKVTGLAAGCERLLTAMAVLVLLGAWSVQAAELPSAKKSKAPAAAAKSPPNVKAAPIVKTPESVRPGLKGGGLAIPRTTREPGVNEGSEGSPCSKGLSSLKVPGKLSKRCAEGETSEGEPDTDPDVEAADEEFEDQNEGDAGQDQGPYGDGGEESTPSFDYDELTGKVPGLTPSGGEDSGSSESSTVEGDRPWYEKLGKPGGGRPPVDDDEE